VIAAIDALALPLQLFALGSALGMTSALLQHRRTGTTDHWPVHVAVGSLALLLLGVLVTAIQALT
jgi:hypothetical protein